MKKTPIAVALERQIPEYIRGEYDLFVKFIKAYYEFLDQTQQRDLEDIRSISNTLDEFIIRFKKELSVLFPTNTIANERFILERIREFYQSRGSKESYQFLFKVLFNKDSDIFYPSTQILRASDGKWVQEKSVFVSSSSGNIFNYSGKIIEIKTKQKIINVFCPRVVYYRDNIYEVFIERAYTQDISIGDTLSSYDNIDTGVILPCPAKYTITNEGSGFEVGKLYFLKTESGGGSLIKITKIGSAGSIKKIQVISFGLDYKSTFYAKLSNKSSTALPYRHPVPGPFPDGTNGFVDYGYINKQDYFYYDKFYTPAINNAETVFYVDGSYSGEIIGSFYTNASTTNVIDYSVAEIKVELGPVAIYPGYYQASDGFISDSCYIQDGKYYQLFSYVIKVEQQIDSYYSIVKELLHPAGLELYAQYDIKNTYLVSASPLLAFIRRQFLEQEYVTDDEATNDVYKLLADIHNTFSENVIDDVSKPIADIEIPTESKYYDMVKGSTTPIEDSPAPAAHTSTQDIKDVGANKDDYQLGQIAEISNKDVAALKQDYPIPDDSAGKFWDISSVANGTFYKTTTASHSSSQDIKDLVRPDIADSFTQPDAFDRTVVFDRSIVPLVSLDPALSVDVYANAVTPAAKADVSPGVGGDWSWDGSTYVLNYPEVRIGVGYIRTPSLVGFQGTLVAGSSTVTLTSGTTDGFYNGITLSKVGGTGVFGTNAQIYSIINSTSFTATVASATSGTISFSLIGDTPQLGEALSSPTDTFPDGSIQGLVKFSFSGSSWIDLPVASDSFDRTVVFDRSIVPLVSLDPAISNDSFPDGSTQGLAKFSFSGTSWSDALTSPLDSTPIRTWDRILNAETINNSNTGLLYYNAYNQNDALDPTTSYSYEAETYSVHDTRAIS
jgi:hypothetical protein